MVNQSEVDRFAAQRLRGLGMLMVFGLLVLCVLGYVKTAKHSDRYINGAFEAVKYHAITGHDPSYAWIVTTASYVRPSGQNDDDWIRITDARAAAWQAEHVGNVAGAK